MLLATFAGFDSAWGESNDGAFCELILQGDGSLCLDRWPTSVTWSEAFDLARRKQARDLYVLAIDQPLVVRNSNGSRPVDRDLARALMAAFGFGAHSANLSNRCWSAGAPIWRFLRALDERGYVHDPMSIPNARKGQFYFECYPHAALIGLFDLSRVSKYKLRHKNAPEWQELIELLQSLAGTDLPVRNIREFAHGGLSQTKQNEDKLDAIISAYVAVYWWKFGTDRSTMTGDLATGYIVTPHSERTYAAFARAFGPRMNQEGRATTSAPGRPAASVNRAPESAPKPAEGLVGPLSSWSDPVELSAVDTSNLWRTSQGRVINSWMNIDRMTGWQLWVQFIGEQGEPVILFEPFKNPGPGLKPAQHAINRCAWFALVGGASKHNPIHFPVRYRYERID